MQPTSSGYLLEHVAGMLHRQADQLLQERLGLGLAQLKILELIETAPAAKQRGLASALGQSEASISRQIKLLQQKGCLVVRVDPAEHRRHVAALTAKGAKMTLAAREVLEQFRHTWLQALNQREQDQLRKLLTQLHEHTCAPGKRLACDRPGDIQTIYANQSTPEAPSQ